MRIAVGLLALALASCNQAKPKDEPSARVSADDDGDHAPKSALQEHVAALKSTASHPAALKRLNQAWEDALAKDHDDRNGPNVTSLLEQISKPLDTLCLDPALKDRERSAVVKLVSNLRDPRTEACLRKTLVDYAPDKTEEDVQQVLRAVAAMKLKSVAPEVMKVFTTAQFKSPKVGAIKTDITSAVLAVVGQAQEDELVKMLGARMSSQDQEGYKNQAFWQTVSARALGELTSEKAVRPLIKVLLTPEKSPIANTALVALVKIGRPSIAAAESLLRSEDADLVAYAKQEAPLGKGKGHVGVAAQILGALGNGSSAKPLIAAIEQASDDAQTKAVIALTLTQLPRSATTIAAFKSVFDEMKYDTETPAGPAKEAMANAAAELFDPTLASHLVKATTDADSKKGPAANVDAARVAALSTAIKLMDIEQVAEVEGLAKTKTSDSSGGPKTVGATLEKELVQAKELAKSCNGEVKCYLAALTNDENQKREKQLIAIKAAYMVGALGRESDRQQLLVALPKISNEAARIAALKALLALAPRGDAAAADELTKLYVEAEQTKNEALMASYRLFLQTAAQLRLRAQ